jgi:hypothetical protein
MATVAKQKQATVPSRITRPRAIKVRVKPNVLTLAQVQKLAACEKIIERNLKSLIEVGNALREIQEGKLYKGTHSSFEAYLREKWDISKSHGYRMIDAVKEIEVSPTGDKIENEHQARKAKAARNGKGPVPEIIETIDGEWVEIVDTPVGIVAVTAEAESLVPMIVAELDRAAKDIRQLSEAENLTLDHIVTIREAAKRVVVKLQEADAVVKAVE